MASSSSSSAPRSIFFSWGDGEDSFSAGTNDAQGGGDSTQQSMMRSLFGDDEEENEFGNQNLKDCCLFLIDCAEPMFEEVEEGQVPFRNAIKAAISVMESKIVVSEDDLVGIVLYGTRESKNPHDFGNVYVLHPFDVCDARRILELEELIDDPEFKSFKERYGQMEAEFPFHDALWTASTLFNHQKVPVGTNRIFLFTNNDSPNDGSDDLRKHAAQRITDLYNTNIDVELLNMPKKDKPFNYNHFYRQNLQMAADELAGDPTMRTNSRLEQLMDHINAKMHKKRSLASLTFSIDGETQIGVKLYNLIQEATKAKFIWLNTKDNQPVKSQTKYVARQTGEFLTQGRIKRYYEYGGKKILFDPDELKEIKDKGEPGLRLLGFKPVAQFKDYYYVRKCSFLYPDESSMTGSVTAFTALWDRMLKKEVYAVCEMVARKSSQVRFVGLFPQEERIDNVTAAQSTPPGFRVVPLPYADDLRSHNFVGEHPRASVDQVRAAKAVVSKLKLRDGFDPSDYPNPSLAKFYDVLKCIALEKDLPEEAEDLIVPPEAAWNKYADLVNEFGATVFGEGQTSTLTAAAKPKAAASRKRKAPGDDSAPAAKKAKVEAAPDNVEQLARDGKLAKLKVAELKAFLGSVSVGIPSKSRKADLIGLVEEHFGVL